jgi:hypothetical protein
MRRAKRNQPEIMTDLHVFSTPAYKNDVVIILNGFVLCMYKHFAGVKMG